MTKDTEQLFFLESGSHCVVYPWLTWSLPCRPVLSRTQQRSISLQVLELKMYLSSLNKPCSPGLSWTTDPTLSLPLQHILPSCSTTTFKNSYCSFGFLLLKNIFSFFLSICWFAVLFSSYIIFSFLCEFQIWFPCLEGSWSMILQFCGLFVLSAHSFFWCAETFKLYVVPPADTWG